MKKIALAAFLAAFVSSASFADEFETLSYAAEEVNLGARPAAMAGAFTAVEGDALSVFYNPAGISGIRLIEFYASYNKWISDSSLQYGYVAVPVGTGTIAGVFSFVNFGKFEKRDIYGVLTGKEINAYNITGMLAYGMPLGDFNVGAGVKLSGLTIDDLNRFGVLFDAGAQYKLGDMFSFGLALQNFDIELSGGYSAKAGLGIKVFNIQGNNMYASADVNYSGKNGLSYSFGTEFNLFKMLSLRAGYCLNDGNAVLGSIAGFSAGAGLTIDKFTIDYSFTSLGDLGATHLVGARFLYEGAEEREKRNYEKLTEFLAYQNYKDGEEQFDKGNYKRALVYWQEVKSMAPKYEGINEAIDKAKRLISSGGSIKKVETLFRQGMTAYEKFDFDTAVKRWTELKKMYPTYKDLDIWLNDAKELRASKGMSKEAEKFFRDGIKSYNLCDYDKALSSWEKGLAKDPKNKKIGQYIDRTKQKQKEMKEGLMRAKADVANDATVIDGIRRLRTISDVCPAYQDANNILSTLKELIALKTRDYYFKGIEQYTNGNLDAAIVYWNNIEQLDPKSEHLVKVKRYITDARNKQRAIQGIEKKKK